MLTFSVGFGPELFGFNDSHGTRWKISAIPLGGYVKFFGDENAASVPDPDTIAAMNADERRVSFFHQPVGARAAVVVAGPVANFVLAIAIFASLFMIFGRQETPARVGKVVADSAAAVAGFESGDLVVSINGSLGPSFLDLVKDLALLAIGLAAYGAVFAVAGAMLKRPLLVGLLFVIGWEPLVMAIPGYLKRLSVAYYLQALVPQAMPGNSPLSLIQELFRENPSLTVSLTSLAVIVGLSLWFAARAVARREYVLEQ